MSSSSDTASLVSTASNAEKPVKLTHTCSDGAQYFPAFRSVYILLFVVVILLIAFGPLLILNGNYTHSGLRSLYAIVLRPFPNITVDNENRLASYLELMEMVYMITGSIFIIFAVILMYGIHVLRKTLFVQDPWDRSDWNSFRLVWTFVCGNFIFVFEFRHITVTLSYSIVDPRAPPFCQIPVLFAKTTKSLQIDYKQLKKTLLSRLYWWTEF